MRVFVFLLLAVAVFSCKKDDPVPADPVCNASGPISVDTGGSYFALPTAFTPNGDGRNDAFFAVLDKIDTADFSLVVSANGQTVYSAVNPYFTWSPPGYTGRRSEFDVEVKFRTQQGARLELCNKLTIPKSDSFFYCAEDIGGLYFADQVDINDGSFSKPTREEECP